MQDKLIEEMAKALWVSWGGVLESPGWETFAKTELGENYRKGCLAVLAAVRAHDAGTDEGLRKALAEGLSWALDLLDMYDKQLIEMGEPAELVYAPIHLAAKEKARKTLQASHAAESAPPLISEGCAYHGASSRICERGTGGCEIHHAAESTAQLDAEDQHPKMRAAPVEDVVTEYKSVYEVLGSKIDELEHTLSIMRKNHPFGSLYDALRKAQADRDSVTAALAVAREGYVKMEDVEKAIWDQFGTWIGTTNFKDGLSEIRARLAPKPSLTLTEEIEAVLRHYCDSDLRCGTGRGAAAINIAALVERRTK